MARPFAIIGFACFGAWFAASLIGFNAIVVLAVLCLLLFLVSLLWPPLRRRAAIPAVFASLAVSFGACAAAEVLYYQPLQRFDGQTVRALVQVVNIDDAKDGCYVVETVQGEMPAGIGMLLYIHDREFCPELYDEVEADFVVYSRGSGDWTASCNARTGGVLFTANLAGGGYTADAYRLMEPTSLSWYARLQQIRCEAVRHIRWYLPGDPGALLCGICFGDKSALSEAAVSAFRLSGISHLIAVSGLHMAIIAQGVLGILRKLRLPRRLSAMVTAAVVLIFMALTGFTPSVTRAGVMCLVLLAGQMVRREADSLNSLGLSLLLILAANPFAVLDVGLWLSFAATLGLLYLLPWFTRYGLDPLESRLCCGRRKIVCRVLCIKPLTALCVTLSAVAFTLPITALVFGEVSLMAPLTNLLTVFPANIALAVGCLGAIFSFVPGFGFLCRGLLFIAGLLTRYLLAAAEGLGSLSFASADAGEPFIALALAGGLLLCCIGWHTARGRGVQCAAALSVMILMAGLLVHGALMHGVTRIAVAGKENSVTLVERGGRSLLVISGERPDRAPIASMLRNRRTPRIDLVVLTETGRYGADALQAVLSETEVGHVAYVPDGDTQQMEEKAGERAMPLDGRSIAFWDDGVLERSGEWLRIRVGETRLLFCPNAGDAASLPEDFRKTHLVAYSGSAPRNAGRLITQGSVLACSAYRLDEAMKSLPRGGDTLLTTVQEGTVEIFTRGRGDLTLLT